MMMRCSRRSFSCCVFWGAVRGDDDEVDLWCMAVSRCMRACCEGALTAGTDADGVSGTGGGGRNLPALFMACMYVRECVHLSLLLYRFWQ